MKYNVTLILLKYRKNEKPMNIYAYFTYKIHRKIILQKNLFYALCGTNNYLTMLYILISHSLSTASLSNIVCRNHSILVFKSTYVGNGTAKVPISAKFGPRVQRLTSEIYNALFTVIR